MGWETDMTLERGELFDKLVDALALGTLDNGQVDALRPSGH